MELDKSYLKSREKYRTLKYQGSNRLGQCQSLQQKDSEEFKYCGVPALKQFYLDPFNKHTSPYGTDVAQDILKYTQQCSTDLMNTYLKQVCNKLADGLKRQRGNQYGFGDDPNSQELATKN